MTTMSRWSQMLGGHWVPGRTMPGDTKTTSLSVQLTFGTDEPQHTAKPAGASSSRANAEDGGRPPDTQRVRSSPPATARSA